ncbi:RHS repeat-associated core domain-containing protein, partial [Actinophytocola sediminis]
GARQYDPTLGRFISVDPIMDLTDPQQMNGYTYSNNNPTTYSDPTGLCPDDGYGGCEDGYNFIPEDFTPPSGGSSGGSSNSGGGGRSAPEYPDFVPDELAHGKTTDKNRKSALESMLRTQRKTPNNPFYEELKAPFCWEFPDHFDCGPPATLVDVAHDFLDVCGFAVDVCDAMNGYIYLREEDWGNAAISAGAMIPFAGVFVALTRPVRKGRNAGKACSFTGDTRVLMADGTTRPIKDIDVGDQVLATDPKTGESGARTVTAVWKHQDTVLDLVTEDGATVT